MKTETLTNEQLSNLIYKKLKNYNEIFKNIKYFDSSDLSLCFASEDYINSLRYIVCYDNDNIYGIGKIAHYQLDPGYIAISFLSVNEKYKGNGFSKPIIKQLVKTAKDEFPQYILSTSKYTVEGWKYMRKNILKECEEQGIKFKDNIVGYGPKVDDEFHQLRKESIELLRNTGIELY